MLEEGSHIDLFYALRVNLSPGAKRTNIGNNKNCPRKLNKLNYSPLPSMGGFLESFLQRMTAVALLCATVTQAHLVISYPGYRGNNLKTSGTVPEADGLGVAYVNNSYIYPYGMEWIYPCERGTRAAESESCSSFFRLHIF